jgi:hypothetical protein
MRRVSVAVGGLAAAALLCLLPLFGDPSPGAVVAHPEWARMVLDGLQLLADEPGLNDNAEQAFATLSGRQSRSFAADRYVRSNRVTVESEGRVRRLRPVGGIGEAVYAMSVARPGSYRVRLNITGPAPAEAELTRAGENAVLRRLAVPAGPQMGWVDAGSVALQPGSYHATVLLPEGSALQHVEVAPPCVHPIEPRAGWRNNAVTTGADVAITLLQALDLESELPPAGPALAFDGERLQLETGSRAVEASGSGSSLRVGSRGARVLLAVDVPASGLYTLSALGLAPAGHRWLADGCRTCVVCPSEEADSRWRTILSARLLEGRHVFAASLGPGTLIQQLRLEPKKDSDEDYLATVERLGLTLAAGPVTREKAEEARRFLRSRHLEAVDACGLAATSGTLVADTALGDGSADAGGGGESGGGETGGGGEAGGGEAGGDAGGDGGGGGGGGNVPPPVLPPLPPASPVEPTRFAGM